MDILYIGGQFHRFSGPKIDTKNTHGTGCTLASAIAAELAKGNNLVSAVQSAKQYVSGKSFVLKY